MIDKKSLLLVVASTTVAVLACEVGLRLLTPYRARTKAPIPLLASAAGSASLKTAAAYVARMDAAPGTDRAWFAENPEPLKRGPIDPALLARDQEFQRRGIYRSEEH